MKKVMLSTLSIALLGTTVVSVNANAATTQPSDLARKVKSYEAVTLKKVTGIDKDDFQTVVYPQNKKLKIVQRKNLKGYDYLITSDNVYIPLDNQTVKIGKALTETRNFDTYHMSKELKVELKKLGSTHPDYKAYKKAAIHFEKNIKNTKTELFADKLAYDLHGQNIFPAGLEGQMTLSYHDWVKSYHKGDVAIWKSNCDGHDRFNVNVLDKKFIKDYFMTNKRDVNGVKVGMDYKKSGVAPCERLGTAYGYGYIDRNIGVVLSDIYKENSNIKVKGLLVIPDKGITFGEAITAYGKPSSVKRVTSGVDEYQAVYDHSHWKVVVGFDSNKGDMKYIKKFNN